MAKSAKRLTFEQAMERLDEIVAAMESGEIGIEDSITRYEEAMKLADHCRRVLDTVEQRIQKIQLESSGQLATEPLADTPPPDDQGDDNE
jgi:exodeoxyribonuclease VII small subunit